MKIQTNRFLILAVIISLVAISHAINAQSDRKLKPVIDGDWWSVGDNPDLGELTGDRQQPVDFGVWQAEDGTWQLWSCIRGTKDPGKTRLFHGWEGQQITDSIWVPKGVKMRADPTVGETSGGLQAPHVIREGDIWIMFYGDWSSICMATSKDGKIFKRVIQDNMERVTAMFSDGAGQNTRDAMVIKIGDTYYNYYTSGAGLWGEQAHKTDGAVYCRTSKDLVHWSDRIVVSRAGSITGRGWGAHECPHVVHVEGYYYLFRTQAYGKNNITTVYRSKDPLDFGIDTDEGYFVNRLPVAAPELILYKGQWFIAALNPDLDGIRMAKLRWAVE
ncbi:hypothetical protein QQ008_22640 [Fulvivirgaceae bacterium BMA10]|uniref:Glycosyl hydrolases family 43 n=1 Tax=Splendidivirga corallicola TaxID=3051826 RepID=A0ABT8KV01_9BACT|nr:hypothetical protein [Fulvivirgaceae bacterium BMA10]